MILRRLTWTSLLISMSLILSRIEISVFFPTGGSVTLFSVVPLIMLSFKYGYKWGVVSGGTFGLIHLLTTNLKFQGLNIFSIVCSVILDYILSYAVIGLASIFKFENQKKFKDVKKIKNTKKSLVFGTIFSFFLKFLIHLISGLIVFCPVLKSFLKTILYDIIYNMSYIIPEMLLALCGVLMAEKFLPNFFQEDFRENVLKGKI